MQDPLFSGEAGAFAYLPSQKVAISVAVTFAEDAFGPTTGATPRPPAPTPPTWSGGEIAAVVAPNDPPPLNRK